MGPGGGSGKVNVQDLSFTKYVDGSSNALILGCCTGEHYDEAVLTVRKAGKKKSSSWIDDLIALDKLVRRILRLISSW